MIFHKFNRFIINLILFNRRDTRAEMETGTGYLYTGCPDTDQHLFSFLDVVTLMTVAVVNRHSRDLVCRILGRCIDYISAFNRAHHRSFKTIVHSGLFPSDIFNERVETNSLKTQMDSFVDDVKDIDMTGISTSDNCKLKEYIVAYATHVIGLFVDSVVKLNERCVESLEDTYNRVYIGREFCSTIGSLLVCRGWGCTNTYKCAVDKDIPGVVYTMLTCGNGGWPNVPPEAVEHALLFDKQNAYNDICKAYNEKPRHPRFALPVFTNPKLLSKIEDNYDAFDTMIKVYWAILNRAS